LIWYEVYDAKYNEIVDLFDFNLYADAFHTKIPLLEIISMTILPRQFLTKFILFWKVLSRWRAKRTVKLRVVLFGKELSEEKLFVELTKNTSKWQNVVIMYYNIICIGFSQEHDLQLCIAKQGDF
jgi:hypothetical protein